MTSLRMRNVSMRYPATGLGISEVSITVESGHCLGLLGPSGCGKTTVLRLLAGLEDPDSGDIVFDDESVLGVPPEERGAAMVFAADTLLPFQTVGANVAFGLKMQRVAKSARTQRVEESLCAVHLDGFEDRWPGELSTGQRQRVALARALAIRPKVLLLDEPLSSLDPELRADMQQTLLELQSLHCITTVLVTHDRDEAEALANSVITMADGTIGRDSAVQDHSTAYSSVGPS